ncbi:MAG: leucyl/phenylalanyl-tRNA--protein transferase [Halioglobus sp.]|nr:leucyl/phenylalanyl-tRNA--protein transferase [Halioglobus sp.]
MRATPRLDDDAAFPPTCEALDEPNGLLAVGGDLSPARLLSAYRRGIFPWYEEPQPILWWTPDPRSILIPAELHLSRSLKRTLRSDCFRVSANACFEAVMKECASLRGDGLGTWIDDAMISAYGELHALGYAHSIEVFDRRDNLVGGLYGVSLGRAFFGESMFSLESDASKVALVALVNIAQHGGIALIDCQVESDHLNSMGARCVSRLDFERRLAHTVDEEIDAGIWRFSAGCGALL